MQYKRIFELSIFIQLWALSIKKNENFPNEDYYLQGTITLCVNTLSEMGPEQK